MISDPKALHYMLISNAYDFPKSDITRQELARILGKGVLFAEGDDHRRQKRLMSPAFNTLALTRLVPIFFEKASHMVGLWSDLIHENASDDKSVTVNVERWLSRCTLDIIGSAGFDYQFGALDNADNALATSFGRMTGASMRQGALAVPLFGLFRMFPVLLNLPMERLKRIRETMNTMIRESALIVENKKLSDPEHKGRDLLTLLLRANESESPKTAMSDEEMRGQLTTMLLAGHETTATALTWALFELASNPEIQDRLRKEIRAHNLTESNTREGLTFEQLNSLPYLDAFTRELLRLHPPVPGTIRESRTANVLPLSKPLADGATSIHVNAGQNFFLSIISINQSKEMWGPDADKFKPERWLEADGISERTKEETSQYALWGNQLTFLAGIRGCIGYRFALAELKAILASIVTNFEISSGFGEPDMIVKRSAIVTKPFIKGKIDDGAQMPIRIRFAQ